MARKSKQAGGNKPLTSAEIKRFGKGYGTQTLRLNGISQLSFGDCALSLHAAVEQPVATPSGCIYERSAILEYLLTKTQELKQQQQDYESWLKKQDEEQCHDEEKKKSARLQKFEDNQKVVSRKKRKIEENPLKRTSYWLAEVQPETKDSSLTRKPPPKRPCSPNTTSPLSRKDLIDLDLKRNSDGQVICAMSEKSITTQQALALISKKAKAQVVLESVFNEYCGKKERTCPVTGNKIKKILLLVKGGSSFAGAGGVVEAKTYRPTMT